MEAKRSDRRRRHYSFILCLWQEGGALPNAPPVWRYSLEDLTVTGRLGFGTIQDLFAYLEAWTANAAPPQSANDAPDFDE